MTQQHPDRRAQDLRASLDEDSGADVPGGTPPAEGLGVGPTNPEMDVERPGERSTGKIVIGVLVALVVVFVLLFVLGRLFG